MNQNTQKKKGFRGMLTILLAAFFIFAIQSSVLAAGEWSVDTADNKIRTTLGTILLLLAAFLALKAYGKGKKGMAVLEILTGAVISIFVSSKDPISMLGAFFKTLFGFGG